MKLDKPLNLDFEIPDNNYQPAQLKKQEDQLKANLDQNKKNTVVEDNLKKLLEEQKAYTEKNTNSLKKHVDKGFQNLMQQVEAFIGIQNYLEKGIKPLSYHGWPISADIGLYIIGLIDQNDYDLIIEFGSGTSTVLMAKALKVKKPSKPVNIITFEHNAVYYEKTSKLLKINEVDGLVDLVHAPLVDYEYKEGEIYSYYSCNEKLQEVAKSYKECKANILVLVDGPPGATNKNARFPALPHLLDSIPGHDFTILMDDYNRVEEKEIVSIWEEILESKNIYSTIKGVACEKGLSVINF